MNQPGRRKFMIFAGGATAAAALGLGFWWRHRPGVEPAARVELPPVRDPAFPNPLRLPGSEGMYGVVEASGPLTIVAKRLQHALLTGKPASMLAYEVEHQGRNVLNPVFRLRTGMAFRAKFWNALEEPSIIHWHGFKVDSNNDGHPHYAIAAGATYDYQFQVANRAGTYWYHPHPHGLTGKQLYGGLAGLFIVEDDEELALQRALDLKLGVTDIPLVIQDKKIDEQGRLVYAPNDEEEVNGYVGDTVLVNFTPRPHFNAATRLYRFRILNGSNARIYRLAFAQGERQLEYRVIGTDGGLLERPYPAKEAFLSPGERLDVLLDLRSAAVGDAVTLQSLAFDPMHRESEGGGHDQHGAPGGAAPQQAPAPLGGMAMDHGAMSGQGQPPSPHAGMATGGQAHGAPAPAGAPHGAMLADGAAIDLLRINVTSKITYEPRVPATFSALELVKTPDVTPRGFLLDLKDGRWRINGEVFEMMKTPVVVKRGANEVWEIRNAKRSMPHPVHLHGFLFRVLARTGSPEQLKGGVVNEQGLTATDLGWKDTVLVWPGETVRVAVDFSHPYYGDQIYLFHCHTLEHGDQGMMINIKIQS